MFGLQLTSGACDCGCSSTTCIQEKNYDGYINPPGSACADATHIRDWLNNVANDPSPGWSAEAGGWGISWTGNWDNNTATTPDAGTITGPSGALLPGGGVYTALSFYGIDQCTKSIMLLPSSTAYIIGVWCDDDGNRVYQQSCVMTGTLVSTGCYEFVIPVPAEGLCTATPDGCQSPTYLLIPIDNYGGFFGGTWADFVAGCTAGTNEFPCDCSLTPGACLSPDPFFGDEPP